MSTLTTLTQEISAAKRNRSTWLAASCALLLAGSFAAWHLSSWPVRLRYPSDGNVGSDSMPLVETVHLRRGVPIYSLASPERYDGANWGPLFYLLGARLVDPQEPSYLPLRLLSLAGTISCAGLCALLAFWLSGSYFAAGLSTLLFLSYGFISRHGTSARCDTVALALCFGAFLIAYRFRRDRCVLLAIPVFLLGFFYKQQFIAGPIAVTLFFLFEKRFRLAIQFAVLTAIGVLGGILCFQFFVFRGQAFLHHFLIYNLLPFSASNLVPGVEFLVLVLLVPLLIGVQALQGMPDKLLGWYLGSSIGVSLMTVARVGSETYYFYEVVLVVCALFATVIAKSLRKSSNRSELVVLFGISIFLGQWFGSSTPAKEDFAEAQTIQNYLRQNFAPDTPSLAYYSGDLLVAGLNTPISNIYHYTWLVRQGTFPKQDLLNQFRTHRFGLIVLNFDLRQQRDDYWTNFYLTKSMRDAILANYRLVKTLPLPVVQKFQHDDHFYVWVPAIQTIGFDDQSGNARSVERKTTTGLLFSAALSRPRGSPR